MIVGLGVSLILIVMFLIIRLGIIKSWYIIKTFPGFFSYKMFYGSLFLGLGFLILILAPYLPYYDRRYVDIWDILFYCCIILSFWFMFRPPALLKPKWVIWIEQEYGYCLDILIEEAQKMNRWKWEARVRTKEGMQAWINDVFSCRRTEIDKRWEEVREFLLWEQAHAEGRTWLRNNERLKGDIPKHRRQEEKTRYSKGERRRKKLGA